MLNIGNKEQEELFKILESNNPSDSLEDDFSSSFDSGYQSVTDSSNIKIGCRGSYCNVIKSVKTLNLDKFKKNLVKNETDKKQKSTISFEETLERFNEKKSKYLTVNDL